MKCPYCNGEMVEGKICSNSALWWKGNIGNNISLNDESGFVGMINGYRITAFRCDNCKKIMIVEKESK